MDECSKFFRYFLAQESVIIGWQSHIFDVTSIKYSLETLSYIGYILGVPSRKSLILKYGEWRQMYRCWSCKKYLDIWNIKKYLKYLNIEIFKYWNMESGGRCTDAEPGKQVSRKPQSCLSICRHRPRPVVRLPCRLFWSRIVSLYYFLILLNAKISATLARNVVNKRNWEKMRGNEKKMKRKILHPFPAASSKSLCQQKFLPLLFQRYI